MFKAWLGSSMNYGIHVDIYKKNISNKFTNKPMCTHGTCIVINQHKFASVWLTTCTINWQKN